MIPRTQIQFPKIRSSRAKSHPPASRPAWRNPWIIGGWLILFIILCANATMIYLAMDTNPGLVVVDYYDRGQNYERTVLSRQALSRKLSLQLDVPPEIRQGEPATFRFTGADNGGRPIEPDAVTLYAYRPSNCAHDFSLPMTKTAPVTKDGEDPYLTRATFPLQGVWDIVIAVEQDGIEHHVARRVTVATTR